MIMYICPNRCEQQKYYKKNEIGEDEKCPFCQHYFQTVRVSQENIFSNEGGAEDGGEKKEVSVKRGHYDQDKYRKRDNGLGQIQGQSGDKGNNVFSDSEPRSQEPEADDEADKPYKTSENIHSLTGKLLNATSDAAFKRLPWVKIYEKLLYKQRISDVQNTLLISVNGANGGKQTEQVVFYGKIKGGINSLRVGMRIYTEGKFNDKNEWMASKVVVEEKTVVSIMQEKAEVLYLMIPVFLLFGIWIIAFLFSAFKQEGSGIFGNGIRLFFVLFFLIFVITAYFLRKVTGRPFFRNLRMSLLIGFILALLLAVAGGV